MKQMLRIITTFDERRWNTEYMYIYRNGLEKAFMNFTYFQALQGPVQTLGIFSDI